MSEQKLNPDALDHLATVVFGCTIEEWNEHIEYEKRQLLAPYRRTIETYLAVAQPEVTSVEELDALPPESYVQGWDGFKHAKTHSGDWVLCVEHTRGAHDAESIELPALVLYRPEVKP